MARVTVDIAAAESKGTADPLVLVIPRKLADGKIVEDEFTCRSEMSEFALIDLAAHGAMSDLDELGGMELLAVMQSFMEFLGEMMEPESWRRFRLRAKKERWKVEDLAPLMATIVESFVGVPTPPASDSQAMPTKSGSPSKVVSLSPPVESEPIPSFV